MNLKGSLPLLILHVLQSADSHGYGIAKHIREQSGGVLDFKEGTLYPTLHSLEKQGYIRASEGMENGRRRRIYTLTETGRAALDDERAQWDAFRRAVDTVLNGSD